MSHYTHTCTSLHNYCNYPLNVDLVSIVWVLDALLHIPDEGLRYRPTAMQTPALQNMQLPITRVYNVLYNTYIEYSTFNEPEIHTTIITDNK